MDPDEVIPPVSAWRHAQAERLLRSALELLALISDKGAPKHSPEADEAGELSDGIDEFFRGEPSTQA